MRLSKTTQEIDQAIGILIRKARTEAGVSQIALADRIGVTFQQIQKYEKGTNRVSVSALVLICSALSVSISTFVSRFEDDEPALTAA